jgi:hypothetical protein
VKPSNEENTEGIRTGKEQKRGRGETKKEDGEKKELTNRGML